MDILNTKPDLSEHDFSTIREMYTQNQEWSRHYESLIVNTNTFLVSFAIIFVGFALNKENPINNNFIIFISSFLSIIGIGLSYMLHKLYSACIERMIKFENIMNCYDETKLISIGYNSILPKDLMKLPVKKSTPYIFFLILHIILILVYIALPLAAANSGFAQ